MTLEIHNIKKHFPIKRGLLKRTAGFVKAVDGVSLSIAQGETLSIVGESGCGKSTLARLIMRLYEPDEGKILLDGRDISSMTQQQLRPLRNKVQMVFQDPYSSLDPLWTIRDILMEAFHLEKPGASGPMHKRMVEGLLAVGLSTDVLNRFPHEFSGGERQRIAIARALVTRPEVLILDEVVSSLDTIVQRQVLDLLQGLKKGFGLTYVFISHNLRVVKGFSDKIAVMHQGKIVESGDNDKVFSSPQHPYTQRLLSAALEYK